MTKEEKYVGKKCFIIDKESIYFGEWGIITEVWDGDFCVAIAGGTHDLGYAEPIFSRDQLRIPRNQFLYKGN